MPTETAGEKRVSGVDLCDAIAKVLTETAGETVSPLQRRQRGLFKSTNKK